MATLSLRRGSEGPSHDPYGYEQWQFTSTKGDIVTMKTGGLGSAWIAFGEKGKPLVGDCEAWVEEQWFMATGMPVAHLERIYGRIHHRCRACGCRCITSVPGMPGELLHLCARCRDVVYCDFNERAIR